MAKIFLSPSNQNTNAYAWGDTNEMAQCNLIAQACETALIRNGFEVMINALGRLFEKVKQSNEWGADMHVCIHTNAYNGIVTGTRVFSYDDTGKGHDAAVAVFNALAPITPGTSESVKPYPSLYEISKSRAPCVYVEAEFHDNPDTAKWIIKHVTEIGEAIAKGICAYCGVAYSDGCISVPAAPAAIENTAPIIEAVKEAVTSHITVRDWQRAAIADGYSFPKYGADGVWGSESLSVAKRALVKKTSPYKNKNLTKLVQGFLGVTADGLCGDKTTAAIKAWQGANGLTADGVIGVNSWKKLLSV